MNHKSRLSLSFDCRRLLSHPTTYHYARYVAFRRAEATGKETCLVNAPTEGRGRMESSSNGYPRAIQTRPSQ